MAVTASGLFAVTFIDVFDTTQFGLDLDLETHKIALFSNSITPNFDSDTAYGSGSYASNEVYGTGWSQGGVALTSTSVDAITGGFKWTVGNVSQTGTTLSAARCGLIYADAASDQAICLVDFEGDYTTSDGTFAINWSGSGVFYFDLTP